VIALIFTGGTISMKVDLATGAAVPALTAQEILAEAPVLRTICEVGVEDFSRLPGPHVTPAHMWRLARRVAAWLERPDVDGIVITHGTDTIEETAYFLDLVLLSEKPVVLVGAMRTISDPSWDGPANLTAAVRVAACPQARGHGALVVMDDHIWPAREVRKIHTESTGSFSAPEFGPVGVVDAGQVVFRRTARPRPSWSDSAAETGLRVARIEPRVELIQAYTGMTDQLIRAVMADGARGLALVAFGRGNVPPAIVPVVEALVAGGALVTVSSRSIAGRVKPRYGYEGGGLKLQQAGAILAGDLSGASARLLQMVALGFRSDVAGACEIIRRTCE